MKSLLVLALACFVVGCQRDGGAAPGFDLLVISDSNGVGSGAWPEQLAARLGSEARYGEIQRLFNESRGGRTLGIDRGGPETNALGGIDRWLAKARRASDGELDAVVLCLGTNDVQTRFTSGDAPMENHAESLRPVLETVHAFTAGASIWIVSPPPVCDTPGRPIDPRWRGAGDRLSVLTRQLGRVAAEAGVHFVDLEAEMGLPACDAVGSDGVHLNASGQTEVARVIAAAIRARDEIEFD